MKILCYGDLHFSKTSSLIRSQGEKFSNRLENCIDTINWVHKIAEDNNVDMIVCLGDFFDKETLDSQEITALTKIEKTNIPCVFLVGNHEMGSNDLSYNSASIFSCYNYEIIKDEKIFTSTDKEFDFHFLPYVLNNDERKIKYPKVRKTIMFSHNDIAGINLGNFVSKDGFDIKDIEDNCDICFNGHIHNGGRIGKQIINVGNITGQNFSEDAFKYKHQLVIFDTDEWKTTFIENPFAFNFYKIDLTETLLDFNVLKCNSIVSFTGYSDQIEDVKKRLWDQNKIIYTKFNIKPNVLQNDVKSETISSTNHIDKFQEYVIKTFGTDPLVISELEEVCR